MELIHASPAAIMHDYHPIDYGDMQEKLSDFLYLSGCEGATDQAIRRRGITFVVNCSETKRDCDLDGVEFLNLDIMDTDTEEIEHLFDAAADKIERHRLAGGKILVHCMAGISRSPTIIMAYFIKHHQKSLWEAHMLIISVRPFIRPNPGFWKQLIEYERRVRKQVSLKKAPSWGEAPELYEDKPSTDKI